jgi:solute carrier family 45 protein 1/2/4
MLALVWIAGPLTGVLVQPYVGIMSDRCQIKWGRRRPFILGGALATIVSIMILAWTREIVGGFLALFGLDRASRGVAVSIMIFAVVLIYILDIAINVRKYGPPL